MYDSRRGKSGFKNKKHSSESKKKISDKLKGISKGPFSSEHMTHLREAAKTRKLRGPHSLDTKTKMKNAWVNRDRFIREETRQKMRLAKMKYLVKTYGANPCLGLNEKELLDKQEQIDNCKIDREYSILGYKPDGYCHSTNIVYEVYESFHDIRVFEDLERENRICNHLSCDFIIIYDKTH